MNSTRTQRPFVKPRAYIIPKPFSHDTFPFKSFYGKNLQAQLSTSNLAVLYFYFQIVFFLSNLSKQF